MSIQAEDRLEGDPVRTEPGESGGRENRELVEWCRRIAAVHHRAERLRQQSRDLTPAIRDRIFELAARSEIRAHHLESGRSRFSLVEFSLAS